MTNKRYTIGQTRILISHDIDHDWEYEIRSFDPGVHNDCQSYYESHEEALQSAKQHIQKCVESAIKKREKELEVLGQMAIEVLNLGVEP